MSQFLFWTCLKKYIRFCINSFFGSILFSFKVNNGENFDALFKTYFQDNDIESLVEELFIRLKETKSSQGECELLSLLALILALCILFSQFLCLSPKYMNLGKSLSFFRGRRHWCNSYNTRLWEKTSSSSRFSLVSDKQTSVCVVFCRLITKRFSKSNMACLI